MATSFDRAPVAIGLDGCRGRWLAVMAWMEPKRVIRTRPAVFASLAEVVRGYTQAVCAVDTPIGLLDEPRPGGRLADQAVRSALGKRAVCVFTPPCAPALEATTYREAQGIQRGLAEGVQRRTGVAVKAGLTVQGFNIFWAMRDAMATATAQMVRAGRMFEVHPELSFAWMQDEAASGGLSEPKKTQAGQVLRMKLLQRAGFVDVEACLSPPLRPGQVAIDDMLDAHAAAWTAIRWIEGAAKAYPPDAEEDPRGVPMQVWA